MMFLKQSTASQSVVIGPFVDSTDGVTAETGLTISNTDIRLSKNGANIVAKNSGGGTHDENGWYTITLDATDTNTVGRLQVHVAESGALPVFAEFQVLEEDIYDALFASSADGFDSNGRVDVGSWLGTAVTSGTGGPDVNVNAISDDTTAATNLEAMFDGTGYAGGTTKLQVNTTQIEGSDATDQINTACDTALTDYDAPTKAEMDTAFTEIKGATWASGTDTLEAIRDRGDAAWITATGFSTHSAADVWAAATRTLTAGTNLNDISTAEVNAEVLDVLNTDTFAEPTGVPGATTTLAEKIGYLYMSLRNKVTITSSKKTFYDDGDTAEWEKDLTDDGTTYTESEGNAI